MRLLVRFWFTHLAPRLHNISNMICWSRGSRRMWMLHCNWHRFPDAIWIIVPLGGKVQAVPWRSPTRTQALVSVRDSRDYTLWVLVSHLGILEPYLITSLSVCIPCTAQNNVMEIESSCRDCSLLLLYMNPSSLAGCSGAFLRDMLIAIEWHTLARKNWGVPMLMTCSFWAVARRYMHVLIDSEWHTNLNVWQYGRSSQHISICPIMTISHNAAHST